MCEPGPFKYISYEEFQLLTFKNPGTVLYNACILQHFG